MERCRRVLGADHLITLLTAAALTAALGRAGEAEPARILAKDTLQRCRRALGPDHPVTLFLTQATRIGHPTPGGDAAVDRPSRPM